MLLTITLHSTHPPATDLGFLLHKNPARVHAFDLSFGKAFVAYPEATSERCTAALWLEVDPVALVRKRRGGPSGEGGLLDSYVNDRPYVASSFLSVAIAKAYGTALSGRSKERADLVDTPLPLTARLAVLPARGGETVLRSLFEPLGYQVDVTTHPLDKTFQEWGDSPYVTLELAATVCLKNLLNHLYVLIPVLDNDKHYWVGEAEVDKLLKRGAGWLKDHPEKDAIAHRYLRRQKRLARLALRQLVVEEQQDPDAEGAEQDHEEALVEKPIRLNTLRHNAVLEKLVDAGAQRVLDLGCGEGRLLNKMLKHKQFTEITGMDVSLETLRRAKERMGLERMPARKAARLNLIQGSLLYRDRRLAGYDAAAVVEVIEHLDPPRLKAFERTVFEFARPGTVVVTTPNVEYNVMFESMAAGAFRHKDHRFEWTREQFQAWAGVVADRYHYNVEFHDVGEADPQVGAPTQMGVFLRDE